MISLFVEFDYTPEWFSKVNIGLTFTLLHVRDEPLSEKMMSFIKVVCNDGFVLMFF